MTCICGHTLSQHDYRAAQVDPLVNMECKQADCSCVAFRERKPRPMGHYDPRDLEDFHQFGGRGVEPK